MVIRDLSQPESIPRTHEDEVRVAPVADRLLALFLDFLIFSPVVSLLGAGILKQIRTSLIIDAKSPQAFVSWILFFVVSFLATWLLQALFIYAWSATPGQRFMQLKVITWPHRHLEMTFSKALVRSFLWCVSFVFLAVPFLEILGHPFRRALHERASDTLVVTLKDQESAPLLMESRFIASWMNMFFLASFVFLAFTGLSLWHRYENRLVGSSNIDKAPAMLKCEQVETAIAKQEITIDRRLDLAMTLWLAQPQQTDCLDKEADYVLWFSKNQSRGLEDVKNLGWAYLAKSQLSLDKKTRLSYLNKVCELDAKSEACELSYLLEQTSLSVSRVERPGLKSYTSDWLLLKAASEEGAILKVMQTYHRLKSLSFLKEAIAKKYVAAVWDLQTRFSVQSGRSPASAMNNLKAEAELKSEAPEMAIYKQVLQDFRKEFDIP